MIAEGLAASDVSTGLNYSQHANATISELIPWNPSQHVYYIEVDVSGAVIYPGGQLQHRTEVQFVLSLPDDTDVYWNYDNDPSWMDVCSTTDRDWGVASRVVKPPR